MKRAFFSILFFAVVLAQDSLWVDHISVRGNENTDSDIILREFDFPYPAKISMHDITYSVSRLKGLNIFTNVQFQIEQTDSGATIVVTTTPKLNFVALPRLEYYQNDPNKASYGAGLKHVNFLGRNIVLAATMQFGYRDGYEVRIRNPWFSGNDRYYFNFSSSYFLQEHPFVSDTDYTLLDLCFVFGKNFSQKEKLGFGVQFRNYNFSSWQALSESGLENDAYISLKSEYQYNSLDFWKYPREGFNLLLNVNASQGLTDLSKLTFVQFDQMFSHYVPLSKASTYAYNVNHSNTFGASPYYMNYEFGDSRLLRGNSDFARQFARNRILFRHELRYELVSATPVSLSLPWVGEFVKNMETSVFSYLWHDSGQVYNQLAELRFADQRNGFGVGVGVIFPYVKRMALELGMSPNGTASVAFALNSFF